MRKKLFCGALCLAAALALGLTGAATAALRGWAGADAFTALRGAAYRAPLAAAALMIGAFTLAGLPLTASFFPRWLLLREMAEVDRRWLWLLVSGGVGVAIGYLRGLNAMLASPAGPNRPDQARPAWLATAFLAALALLSLALGIFPDPLLHAARELLTAYPLPRL